MSIFSRQKKTADLVLAGGWLDQLSSRYITRASTPPTCRPAWPAFDPRYGFSFASP
jgi:hypothetical protein